MRLKLSTGIKFGVVIIFNDDGSIKRQYRITLQELDRVNNGEQPPGLLEGEWRHGKAQVEGWWLDVGDCCFMTEGRLIIKHDESVIGDRIMESVIVLEPGDWAGEVPDIAVEPDKLTRGARGPVAPPSRIIGGNI